MLERRFDGFIFRRIVICVCLIVGGEWVGRPFIAIQGLRVKEDSLHCSFEFLPIFRIWLIREPKIRRSTLRLNISKDNPLLVATVGVLRGLTKTEIERIESG